MTVAIFEKMEQDALESTNKETNTSIYELTDDLLNEGWDYDSNKIYIPFKNSNIFFTIYRQKSKKVTLKYMWVERKGENFKNLACFNRNKLINEEEIEEDGKSSINKKISYTGRISGLYAKKGEYKSFFNYIFHKIIQSDCLNVLKDENFKFPKERKKEESDDEDEYLLEVEENIEYRKKPILDNTQKRQAQIVEDYISQYGLIKYLNPKLNKIHIGEHKNIYRKLLGAFNVMMGKGSYLFETVARAESGKSLEDKIVFEYLIPEEYVFNKNSITESSFLRYGDINEEFFTRLIVNLGDYGSKKAYEKNEWIFNIFKVLITEKNYSKDLSEKNSSGNFINKSLDLKVESIGAAYSTTINSFSENDPQLESRTLSSTPFDTNKKEILNHILCLNTSFSEEYKNLEEAIKELVKFKSYLLSLVNFDKEIINPYGSLFIKYVNESNTPIRELKQLLEFFTAYCVLTHNSCKMVNGHLVASEDQVKTFFLEICLENVLIPYESNFIKMLLAKDKNTQLVVIDDSVNEEDDSVSKEEPPLDPFNEYFNNALEEMILHDSEKEVTYYSELDSYRQKTFINKLLQLYKLGGTSTGHKKNVFFRLTDIKRIYYRYKAYKDIDDVGKLLHTLQVKGYLGKLEFNDPNTKQNIYYLTPKCENITIPMELTDEDMKEAQKYLKKIGIG